jgi:3-isopropylmalate dehydrogenase
VARHILQLAGDGIGPEVIAAARTVLEAVRDDLQFTSRPVGLAALEKFGAPYEPDLLDVARRHDAVMLGAVGGEQRPGETWEARPEAALFMLRAGLGLFANLRPVRTVRSLAARTVLREDLVRDVDLVIVRELTGGLYFGAKERGPDHARDTCEYTRAEIERIVRRGFELARSRRGQLASVDKANILRTSELWREVVAGMAPDYPDVRVEHLLVDNAAIQLMVRAASFDVIVTENLFGDILSDEAAVLSGGLGMLPSASLGASQIALYEPAHGSAPDIAGQGVANPAAAILSAAMLLRHSLADELGASVVESAVVRAIDAGVRTRDLGGTAGTEEFTAAVVSALQPRH